MSSLPADLTVLLAQLATVAGVACLFVGARAWASQVRLDARIDLFVTPPTPSGGVAIEPDSFRTRAIAPLAQRVGKWAESLLPDRQTERIRVNLGIAGFPTNRHLTHFLAAQVTLAASGLVFPLLLAMRGQLSLVLAVLLAAASVGLGFYLPIIWLGRRMARRKQQVLRALPDALDLLSISVSAGLGFDGALAEVVQRWDNALTREFSAVLRDMQLGMSRRAALRAFAARTSVEEVIHFIAAVVQADELGAPIKGVLLVQAEHIRVRRRQVAEERARKATIKMLIPMVFFIFPAMFIVLLGPAVPSLKLLSDVGTG